MPCPLAWALVVRATGLSCVARRLVDGQGNVTSVCLFGLARQGDWPPVWRASHLRYAPPPCRISGCDVAAAVRAWTCAVSGRTQQTHTWRANLSGEEGCDRTGVGG